MLGFRKVRVSASDSTTANRFWVTKLSIRGSIGQGNHFTSIYTVNGITWHGSPRGHQL